MNPRRSSGRMVLNKRGAARWEIGFRRRVVVLAVEVAAGVLLYALLRLLR